MLSGIALALFLAAFSFSVVTAAQPSAGGAQTTSPVHTDNGNNKLILLVIDALSVDDFVSVEWNHLRDIAAGGVIGLMNSRTATSPVAASSAAAHITIGAGMRAPSGTGIGHAFDVTESPYGAPASQTYASTTGWKPPETGVVVPGIFEIHALAEAQGQGARPGSLGQQLAARGKRVAVIGNADVPDIGRSIGMPSHIGSEPPGSEPSFFLPRRHAALIAMNDQGQVPLGTVGGAQLTYDPDWPFAWRTDYEALWGVFTDVYLEADVIVLEFGDFARLDSFGEMVSSTQMAALRAQTIARVDEWIGRLQIWLSDDGADVGLISPSPPVAALRNGLWLTPVLWTRVGGPAQRPGGSSGPALATTATTRRAGIVANTDIADTALASFGPSVGTESVATPITFGRSRSSAAALRKDFPPTIKTPIDPWQAVELLYARAVSTYRLRAPIVQTYVTSAIVVFAIWATTVVYMKATGTLTVSRSPAGLGRIMMLLLCAAPLAMLSLPLFAGPGAMYTGNPAILFIVLLALPVLLLCAGERTLRPRSAPASRPSCSDSELRGTRNGCASPFMALSLATAAVIVLDTWTGSSLMKSSVLGYDPIIGARYYGIGNEYMGVLIGTTLVGTTAWLDRITRSATDEKRTKAATVGVFIVYGLVALTMASPSLGANVGGTVAATVGFGLTAAPLTRKRLSLKTVVVVGAGAVLVLAGAATYDLLVGRGKLSHLGQTVLLVQQSGLTPLAAIVARKLSMNMKLLRWTIWAQVFVVSLGVSVFALYRPGKSIRRMEVRHPQLLNGIRGAVVAALVALVANDSGVVAAATMMIPVTATLTHIVLHQYVDGDTTVEQ